MYKITKIHPFYVCGRKCSLMRKWVHHVPEKRWVGVIALDQCWCVAHSSSNGAVRCRWRCSSFRVVYFTATGPGRWCPEGELRGRQKSNLWWVCRMLPFFLMKQTVGSQQSNNKFSPTPKSESCIFTYLPYRKQLWNCTMTSYKINL